MLWRVTVQRENPAKPIGFSPQQEQAQNGDGLFWFNEDRNTQHQPVPDTGAWNIPVIGPGQSSDELRLSTGTFPYHCAIHGDETGTVIVAAAVLIAAGANPLFGPTQIKPGQCISWGNSDAQAHQPCPDTGDPWFSEPIASGDLSKPVTFSTSATINYRCALHPDNPAETGTITVKA
jgi:plastocyanin